MKRPGSQLWPQKRPGLCSRVAWASLTPFVAALLVGTMVFRAGHRSNGLQEAVVQRHPARVLEETLPCPGTNCELQGGSAAPAVAAGASNLLAAGTGGDGGGERDTLPKLFLFIGILSGRGYRHRRLAVREAWSNKAQVPGQVVSKFILSDDERTPQVEKELESYGDIVFVREKTNYKSILYKTFYVLEYAARNYDAAFVLKTDDDAFINVPPMVQQLRTLCENPGCVNERIYMGRMAKHSEVLLQPGHKWNNMVFHNHTGLSVYPNYMMGGGYIMGGEVARVLVDVHSRMHLKFTPIEDATLGFWLMAMDLRHVDHPRFYTWAAPCCFKPPTRKPGERFVSRFQLADDFEASMCGPDPWLVLHKIDSPTKMRFIGSRIANCTAPDPWLLPSSIQEYFSEDTRKEWAEKRVAMLKAAGRPMDPPPPPPADDTKSSAKGSSSSLAAKGTTGATVATVATGTGGSVGSTASLAAAASGTAGAAGKVGTGADTVSLGTTVTAGTAGAGAGGSSSAAGTVGAALGTDDPGTAGAAGSAGAAATTAAAGTGGATLGSDAAGLVLGGGRADSAAGESGAGGSGLGGAAAVLDPALEDPRAQSQGGSADDIGLTDAALGAGTASGTGVLAGGAGAVGGTALQQ